MLEQLIERMKIEGKITQEEIDTMVADLKAQQPPTQEELKMLKRRQDESENAVMMLMELTMMGGM